MIARLKGKVIEKEFGSIILDVNNVGYFIYMSSDKVTLNQEVFLYTHFQVKEDANILYGFVTLSELKLFEKLISVKGIGGKTAISFFNFFGEREITNAIENGDIAFLKKLPGVGAKSAQQIVLDLKGKLQFVSKVDNVYLEEALSALKSLGYQTNELKAIEKELSKVQLDSSQAYVKLALQLVAKAGGKK